MLPGWGGVMPTLGMTCECLGASLKGARSVLSYLKSFLEVEA